jgi:hypothetical protein
VFLPADERFPPSTAPGSTPPSVPAPTCHGAVCVLCVLCAVYIAAACLVWLAILPFPAVFSIVTVGKMGPTTSLVLSSLVVMVCRPIVLEPAWPASSEQAAAGANRQFSLRNLSHPHRQLSPKRSMATWVPRSPGLLPNIGSLFGSYRKIASACTYCNGYGPQLGINEKSFHF